MLKVYRSHSSGYEYRSYSFSSTFMQDNNYYFDSDKTRDTLDCFDLHSDFPLLLYLPSPKGKDRTCVFWPLCSFIFFGERFAFTFNHYFRHLLNLSLKQILQNKLKKCAQLYHDTFLLCYNQSVSLNCSSDSTKNIPNICDIILLC